jgi:hypothetical protein
MGNSEDLQLHKERSDLSQKIRRRCQARDLYRFFEGTTQFWSSQSTSRRKRKHLLGLVGAVFRGKCLVVVLNGREDVVLVLVLHVESRSEAWAEQEGTSQVLANEHSPIMGSFTY